MINQLKNRNRKAGKADNSSVPADNSERIISLKLEKLLEQQTFISDILQQLQETKDISVTIQHIISLLGKYCGASSIRIFEKSPHLKSVSNTFEWCREDVESRKHLFQNIIYENFPMSRELLSSQKMIRVLSREDLPPDMKSIFPHYNNAAILIIAMEYGGEKTGFVNFVRYKNIAWEDDEVVFIKKVVGVLATAIIRRRMEEAVRIRTHELLESETKFRTIVQQLSDLILIIDSEGTIRYVSPAVHSILGYQPSELVNTNVAGYIYPEDLEFVLSELAKTKEEQIEENELPSAASMRLLDAKGKIVIVKGIGRNELDNEAIGGIIITLSNITEERKAQQKIQNNLERQELMNRLLQEFHYTTDIQESLQQILSRLGEYAESDSAILAYWFSPEKDNFQNVVWETFAGRGVCDILKAIPPDIFMQWAEFIKDDFSLIYDHSHLPDYVKPYFTPDEIKRIYVFPFARHVTTKGLMIMTQNREGYAANWEYHELSFLQNTVQIISNSIERDITQKNLVKAKERAEEADNLKSAFLANMSHEIRTPMNGIMGFASLMQKESATIAQRKQYSQIINDNCQILLQLLDDIIDISKLESKQLKISLIRCNLNSLLSDFLMLFRQLLHKKGKDKVQIILEDNDLDETVFIDPVRVQQILTNLVNNAIKFTDKGFISFGYNRTEDGLLIFRVQDTGTGIPRDQQIIIFERFRQVEKHKERNIGGTGLGLAISKNLVELMGGKIWVESEPGLGSTFYFTIDAKSDILT
jgi:PAS domain S-box-containing protein